jgi:hypothetical protein
LRTDRRLDKRDYILNYILRCNSAIGDDEERNRMGGKRGVGNGKGGKGREEKRIEQK